MEPTETLGSRCLAFTPPGERCQITRARLTERGSTSLDAGPNRLIEEAGAAEVEWRQAEIYRGAVSLLPGPEISAMLAAGSGMKHSG